MSADRLADLSAAGVSIWLDDLDRGRLESGGLAALVEGSHVVGVTTNPSIFDKAITSGAKEYAAQVQDLAVRGVDLGEAIRALTTYDVRWACDVLAPVHARTGGVDGRVSIEVDPRLARATAATIAEAEALRREADAYVDTRIATFEASLQKTMGQVRTMRERLASRSSLDDSNTQMLPRAKA